VWVGEGEGDKGRTVYTIKNGRSCPEVHSF